MVPADVMTRPDEGARVCWPSGGLSAVVAATVAATRARLEAATRPVGTQALAVELQAWLPDWCEQRALDVLALRTALERTPDEADASYRARLLDLWARLLVVEANA